MEEGESAEMRGDTPQPRKAWVVFGKWAGLCAAVFALALLAASRTDRGAFYLTFPSMSWSEYQDICRKAEAGDAESQLYRGVFYANGDGVKQDYTEAAQWYEKSAKQENARAMRNLALLYECGVGVERDYQKAFDLYWRAAELGDAAAHFGVAGFRFTWHEKIMPPELGEYAIWLLKAFCLLELQLNNNDIYLSFWSQYNSHALYYQNDAYLIKKLHTLQRHSSDASLLLSKFYYQGIGVKRNLTTCNEYLHKSAEQGNPRAKYILSEKFLGSRFAVDQIMDSEINERYIREAAESEEEDIFIFEYTKSKPMSKLKEELTRELLRRGNEMALYFFISADEITEEDRLEGLKKLVESENYWAIEKMAFLYAEGRYVEKNYEISDKYFTVLFSKESPCDLLSLSGGLSTKSNERIVDFINRHRKMAENGDRLSKLLMRCSSFRACNRLVFQLLS